MKTIIAQSLLLLIPICCLLRGATPASIGVVQSNGELRVDGATVRGNSALHDGSVIETSRTPSEIRLAGGASMKLDPRSTATVYRDRMVLRQGAGVLRNSEKMVVNARTLRIASDSNDGVVRIALNQTGHVVVTAQIAAAEVYSAGGLRVGRLFPGMALDFDPQAASAEPSKVTGCLVTKGAAYVLTDTTTNVAVELQGANLSAHAGRTVEVIGPMTPNVAPVREANQIVRVATIKDLGPCPRGAITPPAGRGPAGSGTGTAAGVGAAHSAIVIGSIVAGVAVAATFAGLAATGAFSGSAAVSPSQ